MPTSLAPDRIRSGQGILVLIAVLLAVLMFPLTITGAALALPGIAIDLAAGLDATQWVVNSYAATFAVCLAVAGSLADRLGHRRIFTAGVVLFLTGCVASALAEHVLLLVLARGVSGVGAAAATAGGSALLAATFSGAARSRAFGLLGAALGTGLAFGPFVSGLVVESLGWRAVFGVPAVLAGLVLVLVPALPSSAGLVERGDKRFDSTLLANPRFLSSAVAAAAFMGILVPLVVYLPSYLIAVVGVEVDRAGLWMLLLTTPVVLSPALGTLLARRLPEVVFVAGSLGLGASGALLLLTIGADATPWGVAVPFLAIGTGVGLTMGVLDGLAIESVRPESAGTAAGLLNTARLVTETASLVVVGAVLAAVGDGRLEGAGFTRGLHLTALLLGGFGLLCAGSVVLLGRRRG